MTDVAAALDDAHRREWAYVVAATVRVSGDLDVAEECAADAFALAWERWPRDGVPATPGAWLTTTARNRALDMLRRDSVLRRNLPLLLEPVAYEPADIDVEPIPDDRLRLLFLCTHPALAPDAQLALTLRLACGLTVAEIARVQLTPEATVAARITRAKKKITAARIPFATPLPDQWGARLDGVLTSVHLVHTVGHAAPDGPALLRVDVAERALHLARVLHALMPDEPEPAGLLAMALLAEARASTRVDSTGRLVLLADQDRSRWDIAGIAEAGELVRLALSSGRAPGRYALQAAIAALHAEAPTYEATDWRQIIALYDVLLAVWPSPVVALNRAVAVAMADGPAVGLALLDDLALDERLARYHYLPAARADLLRRLGHHDEAARAYESALELVGNEAERDFLSRRLAECTRVEP